MNFVFEYEMSATLVIADAFLRTFVCSFTIVFKIRQQRANKRRNGLNI